LREAAEPGFQAYARQVVRNAQALVAGLAAEGTRPVTGGTDTHLAVADLTDAGVTGVLAEQRCEQARIMLNKNSVPYDSLAPSVASGIRVGAAAVTTQGMGEEEMRRIAGLIVRAARDPDAADDVAAEVAALVGRYPAYSRQEVYT